MPMNDQRDGLLELFAKELADEGFSIEDAPYTIDAKFEQFPIVKAIRKIEKSHKCTYPQGRIAPE